MTTIIHMVKPQLDGGPGSGPQAGKGRPGFGQSTTGAERRKLKNAAERKKRDELLTKGRREQEAKRQRGKKDLKKAGGK